MGFLIDASILIAHERGRLDLDTLVREDIAGATAVARGLTLTTANAREFDRVPGLALERWQG